jgi:penicillin amidase
VRPVLGERRWPRRVRRLLHAVIAAAASAAVLALLAFGYGPVPALGPALVPGHGVWASAAGGRLPGSQRLALPGLADPVRVWFTSHGVASIRAADSSDAFLALGYLHASFRLTEMDLERREAEGRLAQLAGPSAVGSDKFELRLGLLRTARREWAQMPKASPAARALIAYARGVNDYLAHARASRQWPAMFSMTGVYPPAWTPVDSLAVQGELTQELDFTTAPLDYALLERSLGAARTMSWFPVLPVTGQDPYDPGPYRRLGIAALPASSVPARLAAPHGPAGVPARTARAAAAVLRQVAALPAGQVHDYPDSNAWAANGPRVAGGGALLAGDPHLPQTLPSVWYQVALLAPGLSVSGVSVPGLPGILIGRNKHIAWSLTDTQNQATLFYSEQTSRSRPGEYFWRGRWRRMRQVHYTIPVRGGHAVALTVDITVHGPVMTRAGQTMAVDWMGGLPSADIAAMLGVYRASSFAQFRRALAGWGSPTQNFVYADDRGNIGAISAGYYPLVRRGDPWLPLPGTGAYDVAGVIPYAAVPQVYDPPGHVIATANQRPVGPSYPYYIGTTADFFDPGYRASAEYAFLRGHTRMRPASFAALQTSLTDVLAARIVPRLLGALRGAVPGAGTRHAPEALTGDERAAEKLLAGWNDSMGAGSAAASIWWTFWNDYLSAVFGPWWASARVPVHLDRAGLSISAQQFSLDQVLESWTLHDQRNPAFTPPGGRTRDAAEVMRAAFALAVAHLGATLRGGPASWAWGRLHSRRFPSLTQAAALGYGPRPAGGDPWTVDAADGGLTSTAGPTWRMIVHLTGSGSGGGEGIYPGGQSENPASPWYADQIPDWWAGRYLPMPPSGGYRSGPVEWELVP